jgi:hypothetical protein
MVAMERTETIECPSGTGHKEVRAALAVLAPMFFLRIFYRNYFPFEAEGMGRVLNMKITKRTQSKNGKVL